MKLVENIDKKVAKVVKLYEKKKEIEQKLSEVNKELDDLLKKELPNALVSNGMMVGSDIQFKDYKISLKAYKDVKVKDEKKFYDWLELNNYGDIIKEELSANLRYFKDKDKVKQELQKMGLVYEIKQSIHHQTLKSFAKEIDLKSNDEAGVEVVDGVIATIK